MARQSRSPGSSSHSPQPTSTRNRWRPSRPRTDDLSAFASTTIGPSVLRPIEAVGRRAASRSCLAAHWRLAPLWRSWSEARDDQSCRTVRSLIRTGAVGIPVVDRLPYWPMGASAWAVRCSLPAAAVVLAGTGVWCGLRGAWGLAVLCVALVLVGVLSARVLRRRRQPLAVILRDDALTFAFLTSTARHPVAAIRSVNPWRKVHLEVWLQDDDRPIHIPLGPGSLPLRRRLIATRPELDAGWPVRRFRFGRIQTALMIIIASVYPLTLLIAFVAGVSVAITRLIR